MNFKQAAELAELVRWRATQGGPTDLADRVTALEARMDAVEQKRKPGRPRKVDATPE